MTIKTETIAKLRMIESVLRSSKVPMNSDEISEEIRHVFHVNILPSSISSLIASNYGKVEIFNLFGKSKFVVEIITGVGSKTFYKKRVYFWVDIKWQRVKEFRKDLLVKARRDPRHWKKPARQLELFGESDFRQ